MTANILHLSHTDIRVDSRILKQLKVLAALNKKIIGIGVNSSEMDEKVYSNQQLDIITLELLTKKINILPRFLRHVLNFFELNIKLIRYIVKFKPSVAHCHDTTVLPIGVFMGFFYDYKIIYDAHELESNRNGQGKFFSYIILSIEKILWKRIDVFISVSDSIIEWYGRNIGYKESFLILNSPDIKITTDKNEKINKYHFHELYSINRERKIFIYLGIIGEGRGIQKYVQVFSDDDLNADIVFVGYGELTNYVKQASTECNRIHYHEPVKHDEVVGLVKSADFGLCFIENISLSDYYCLPNKLFEYAFSGLTIIGSNFPEISKVVEKYNLGYTAEPEVKEISELILTIVNKPKIEFKDIYDLSWPAQAKKLEILYSKFDNCSTNELKS
jgi:glycosyltransferase involved in cell wall biosynthesis